MVRSHGWYDLPPFTYDRPRGVLSRPDAVFSQREGSLVAESERLDASELTAVARRVFSLEIDLTGFAALLAGEPPHLREGLARGGGRMLRGATLFEDAVKMLLTTNCTWAATRGMVVRLVALGDGGGFPRPDVLARLSPAKLRDRVRCGYRAEPLSRLSRRVASGKLDLSCWEDAAVPVDEVRGAILEEHGFGPYAAEGLLRILGRHDYLALDSWIRQQYRKFYPGPKKKTDAAIARRYARFGRYKGLALWLDLTRGPVA